MKLTKHDLKEFLIIVFATLLTALSLELFLIPDDIVIGGVTGIATILDILLTGGKASLWYFSTGMWFLLINVPICVFAFFRFKKRFATKTFIYGILLGCELLVLRVFGVSEKFTELVGEHDRVVYLLVGGVLQGLSLPLMLSVNASTGGSDLIGLELQKKDNLSGSHALRAILIANIIIVLLASVAFYFVKDNAESKDAVDMFIYSVVTMFVGEIVQETVFNGFSSNYELQITTDRPQEVSQALRTGLSHGATIVKVTGGYSLQEKYVVVCVIGKRQLVTARRIINQVDSTAFAYVEKVKEVIGKGFSNKEEEMTDK